jgi:hypothetical protein
VDAATRGDGDAVSSLYVLAPETIGTTRHAQPSLFWFQTKPARLPFEFALLRPGEAKPVLALHWPDGLRSGFQRLRLADHGIALEPNIDYQWVVALVRDPQSRSRDIISSGWIHRISGAAAGEAWYDTLETLADQIAEHPQERRLRAKRADLLRGADLIGPANADTIP